MMISAARRAFYQGLDRFANLPPGIFALLAANS
jgi:hypothetical protein